MLTMLIYVKFYVATLKPHFNHHDKYKINIYLCRGNDSNLLIVFYVQIMPDDFVMQLHRF
ncbi:hypothetical protein RG49_19245 [Escherichia coli]|nr:hypothetical protein RG49_19245 [Escherichia coli]